MNAFLHELADVINRARYTPGGLPEIGVDEEREGPRKYAYRLARAAARTMAVRLLHHRDSQKGRCCDNCRCVALANAVSEFAQSREQTSIRAPK